MLDNALDRAVALDGRLSAATLGMTGMSGRSYPDAGQQPGRLRAGCALPRDRLLDGLGPPAPRWRATRSASSASTTGRKFDGPKDAFLANVAGCVSEHVAFGYIERDFRQVDYTTIGRFNIYLFDGPHSPQDHYDGVSLPLVALDETFFFIVDDWNWEGVRLGTAQALRSAGLTTLYSIEIRTTQDGSHAAACQQNSDWHNGYFIAVLQKPH